MGPTPEDPLNAAASVAFRQLAERFVTLSADGGIGRRYCENTDLIEMKVLLNKF
jgi:hypothetical protein